MQRIARGTPAGTRGSLDLEAVRPDPSIAAPVAD
jgi:hypothetical protein